jgi:hypothetical protein
MILLNYYSLRQVLGVTNRFLPENRCFGIDKFLIYKLLLRKERRR